MAIGPVQLLVLGFEHPDFHGEVIEELEKLRESDTVRVIDSLAVYKDAAGEMEVMHLSNLSKEEAIELGSKVAALIGLGIEGEEGMEAGAALGAEAAAEGGIEVFSDEDAWDVLEEIPNDSAAALILLEHHWAVPLRDAIVRAGGIGLADSFIHPADLVALGLATAAEAEELEAMHPSKASGPRRRNRRIERRKEEKNGNRTGPVAGARLRAPGLPRGGHRGAREAPRERHGARDRLARGVQGRRRRDRGDAPEQPHKDEAIELGSKVAALIGLGIEGEEGIEAGAALGAEAAAEGGIEVFSDEDAWDVLEEIPNDTAAALILLEHHWAVPLRDAIVRAGGIGLADSFIHPADLVALGLATAAEAEELEAMHPSKTPAV